MDFDLLNDFLCNLRYTEQHRQELYARFQREVDLSLQIKSKGVREIKSYITYVQHMPSGNEQGNYLCIHIGKRFFRFVLLKLHRTEQEAMPNKNYEVPQALLRSNAEAFFDNICVCLDAFLKSNNIGPTYGKLPLGMSMAFSTVHTSISEAILKDWPYKTDGFVGHDVGKSMNDALKRKKLNVECVAVFNNAVDTLISCSRGTICRIGLIVGQGSNACFYEESEKIEFLEEEYKENPYTVINYEWGHLGDRGSLDFLRTAYDKEIDNKSQRVHLKTFEKMVSAFYMGQMLNLVVLKAVKDNILFQNHPNKKLLIAMLRTRKCLNRNHLYDMATDEPPNYVHTKSILVNEMDFKDATTDDCVALLTISDTLTRRSAILVGTLVAYLIERTGDDHVLIAAEGEMFRNHEHYKTYMDEAIKSMLVPGKAYTLEMAENGPAHGGALIVANAIPANWGDETRRPPLLNLPEKTRDEDDEPRTQKQRTLYKCCKCDK